MTFLNRSKTSRTGQILFLRLEVEGRALSMLDKQSSPKSGSGAQAGFNQPTVISVF